MQTLSLAMEASPDEGKALPNPFRSFPEFGINFRRGQVSLVAAASGGGKSALATHIAVHSNPKIPTLYCSADTDKVTLGTRIAASVLNQSVVSVESSIRRGDESTRKTLTDHTDHIWFYWDSAPSEQDIEDELEAYALVTGAWPHLIVLDNLINIDSGGSDVGHVQKDAVMHWAQQLANLTNAHIMVLHHVTGAYEDGLQPIPKSGLLDKVAKRPRLVLTLYRLPEDPDHLLGVRVVKNSSGRMDPSGNYGPDIAVMFEKAWMKG